MRGWPRLQSPPYATPSELRPIRDVGADASEQWQGYLLLHVKPLRVLNRRIYAIIERPNPRALALINMASGGQERHMSLTDHGYVIASACLSHLIGG